MLSWLFVIFHLVSAKDICQTKYTLLHYAESECVTITRPLNANSSETFDLRSVLITKKLDLVDQQETIVLVPGGPGDSGENLLLAMQEREVINSMWYSMNVNIIVYDPRGTGTSKLPKETNQYGSDVLSIDLFIEDLKAVIEKTARNKPVVLLAHSAGGHVVLRFVEKYPNLVKKLVLVSTSISPRQMAELTLGLQAKESLHWNKFLNTIKDEKLKAELNKKYQRVEDVILQQQKARILNQYVHPNLKKITVSDMRNTLITHLENDPSGKSFIDFLNNFYRIFDEMDVEGPLLVPQELKQLKLKPTDFNPIKYYPKDWMIRLFVCGEGLTKDELKTPLLLDGLTMEYYCGDLHSKDGNFKEPVLENIQTPVLFFSGLQDGIVPTSYAKETVRRLPHARIVIEKEAGHNFFDKKPAVFYDQLKAFLAE